MQVNPGAPVKQGDTLDGRYTLRDCVAHGGMGRVYVAHQPALERTVAIKLLHPELAPRREYARCIRDEAIAASRVRSPHCVKVIDCSALPDGTPYLVMEHIPGRSLRDIVADEVIPVPRAIDLLDQILSALRATHDAGIVHADVKSDNFLVETADGKDHVTMIDFGLARVLGAPVSLLDDQGESMVLGTPEYMAPEVVRGKPPTPLSDLYGAGIILYELLTGATPFNADNAAVVMRQQLHDVIVPPSLRQTARDIPPALDHIVLRALDKRPEARFADAAAFARELRACGRRSRGLAFKPAPRPAQGQSSATPLAPTLDCGAPQPVRLAQGSDCAVRRAVDTPEPRWLGDPPQDPSSFRVVKNATRSEISWSVKPR